MMNVLRLLPPGECMILRGAARRTLRLHPWACRAPVPVEVSYLLTIVFAVTQIILCRARRRALGNILERIEFLLAHADDTAIRTHSHYVESTGARWIHPVSSFELRGYFVDRALDAERLVATDAKRGFLFLDNPGRSPAGTEIDLRLQGDHLFRAPAPAS